MKKIVLIFALTITLLFSVPLCANATPQGYMEVKLTSKNINKYIAFKKEKLRDPFGDYIGFYGRTYSKLLKKGYYIYDTNNFAVKGTYKVRTKYTEKINKKKHTFKNTQKVKFLATEPRDLFYASKYEKNCSYKYTKVWDWKIKKSKGTIIFVEPSNIISIERSYSEYDGDFEYTKIKVKYPYDDRTHKRYDANGNVEYYFLRYTEDLFY